MSLVFYDKSTGAMNFSSRLPSIPFFRNVYKLLFVVHLRVREFQQFPEIRKKWKRKERRCESSSSKICYPELMNELL